MFKKTCQILLKKMFATKGWFCINSYKIPGYEESDKLTGQYIELAFDPSLQGSNNHAGFVMVNQDDQTLELILYAHKAVDRALHFKGSNTSKLLTDIIQRATSTDITTLGGYFDIIPQIDEEVLVAKMKLTDDQYNMTQIHDTKEISKGIVNCIRHSLRRRSNIEEDYLTLSLPETNNELFNWAKRGYCGIVKIPISKVTAVPVIKPQTITTQPIAQKTIKKNLVQTNIESYFN